MEPGAAQKNKSFYHRIRQAFPQHADLVGAIRQLPLKARSLLIKQCQSQYDVIEPVPQPPPTIVRLLDSYPDVSFVDREGLFWSLPLRSFFAHFEKSVNDPLQSAFFLDLLRGLPVENTEKETFIRQGWVKEVNLAYGRNSSEVNFRPLLFDCDDIIHPDIPLNKLAIYRSRAAFRNFRQRLIDQPRTFYPRSSHKNMSRSTRREYEEKNPGANLDNIPIFGQDDWQRFYNETGIELEGEIEMRQTWTASQAKPRVYAANGGTSYKHSRHLQEFFTDLTDIFRETNHKTRLRPGRLYVPPLLPNHEYFIYDLTAFTSNMREQRNFCSALAEFMVGVTVYIVDEVDGLIERDLGDMLNEYNLHCVCEPELSLERGPIDVANEDIHIRHGIASLLGIFGNLMTCTVAHHLLITCNTDSNDENNVAGDDGLVIQFDYSESFINACVSLAGDYEREKCFSSREEGAICLKRPLLHLQNQLLLCHAIIPPNLVTMCTYISGREVDDRYHHYRLQDMTFIDRVNVVGMDLMRFLMSAYSWQLEDIDELERYYLGFQSLANGYTGMDVARWASTREDVIWPYNPKDYSFYDVDPFVFWCQWNAGCRSVTRREEIEIGAFDLRYVNDKVVGNQSPRLRLLEKLGYLVRENVKQVLTQEQSYTFLILCMFARNKLAPQVFTYTCIRDIPECFMFL
jgi:hypothetical protein